MKAKLHALTAQKVITVMEVAKLRPKYAPRVFIAQRILSTLNNFRVHQAPTIIKKGKKASVIVYKYKVVTGTMD